MLVTDRRACGERRLEDVVEAAVEGGVNVVQLREKDLPAAELYDLALRLRQIVGTQALLLVNDRVDVALAAGAHGVELGGSGLPTEVARKLAPDLLIGRSVHDVAHAADAVRGGADLLVVGTMFASRSHPGHDPAGPVAGAEDWRRSSTVPLIGIGGITAANATAGDRGRRQRRRGDHRRSRRRSTRRDAAARLVGGRQRGLADRAAP